MNANRLINMIFRMALRKGLGHLARRGGGAGPGKGTQTAAKRLRQAQRITRKF